MSRYFGKNSRSTSCGTGFQVSVWCNKDPCGIICATISWFLILYAQYVVVGIVIYPWMEMSAKGMMHIVMFSLCSFMALVSHARAMLTDPGAVPEEAIPVIIAVVPKEERQKYEDQKYRMCRKCQIYKPVRAHHCSMCNRCVLKMDHHCPWVNNCVGLGNHKFFLLFIFYVCLLSMYALALVFGRYAHCINSQSSCPVNGAMHVMLLVVESLLFGLFTICMMCDQYSVITTGTTQIDRLKGEKSDNLGVHEVFGGLTGKFSYHWLLPSRVVFPTSLKRQILGYVRRSEIEDDENVDASEMDVFISSLDSKGTLAMGEAITTKETLEGGWSVEKHVVDDHLKEVQVV